MVSHCLLKLARLMSSDTYTMQEPQDLSMQQQRSVDPQDRLMDCVPPLGAPVNRDEEVRGHCSLVTRCGSWPQEFQSFCAWVVTVLWYLALSSK